MRWLTRDPLGEAGGIEWAHAEALAYASLVLGLLLIAYLLCGAGSWLWNAILVLGYLP